jgi:hypothetical protein
MVSTVIVAYMDLIGQLQSNTPVKFVKVDMDQALAARKDRAELLGNFPYFPMACNDLKARPSAGAATSRNPRWTGL